MTGHSISLITEASAYQELMVVTDPQVAEVSDEQMPEPRAVETKLLLQVTITPEEQQIYENSKSKAFNNHEVVLVKSQRGYGRVYVGASVGGNSTPALLDTGATLSVSSEEMAEFSIPRSHIEPPDIEPTSATNHKVCFVGKARVKVQVGGCVELEVTLYIAKDFFRSLLFGVDFMNEARASLSFPANTLAINGQQIPTKIGKVK